MEDTRQYGEGDHLTTWSNPSPGVTQISRADGQTIRVPSDHVRAFVADAIRLKMRDRILDMDAEELLDLRARGAAGR